ncbi:MAG TPA: hypothetical protein VK689_20695 [Armatimonadota bacterium]|nr:hypothetical protein [Armatimonadota bacterium]
MAHLEQARHNYSLFERLRGEGIFLDWAVTVLFYTALQLVDAHAAHNGYSASSDHMERRRYVWRYLRPVHARYRDFEDASRDTRYDLRRPTDQEVQRHLEREFRHLEAQLRSRGIAL